MSTSMAYGLSLICYIISMICVGIWTFRDAKRRNLNANLWTTLAVLIPFCIGFIVYIAINPKQSSIQCSYCSSIMKKNVSRCPNCGAQMAVAKQTIAQPDPANKKFFVSYIVCVVGVAGFFVYGCVHLVNSIIY